MKRKWSKWTSRDDDLLRRFVAERKWSDRDIAEIIGRGEITVRRHRKLLGLPCGKAWGGMRKGCKWNEESRKRLSERMKERMSDPDVRAEWMELAWKGNRARWKDHHYLPPKGTPERKLYRKLRDSGLPADVARQEIER